MTNGNDNKMLNDMLFNIVNNNISVLSEVCKTLESINQNLDKITDGTKDASFDAQNRGKDLNLVKNLALLDTILLIVVIIFLNLGLDIGWLGELFKQFFIF